MNLRIQKLFVRMSAALLISAVTFGLFTRATNAETPHSDFYLQVTPSPLIASIKPGTTTQLQLKIKNAGTGTEELQIAPRSFTVDEKSGAIKLNDTQTPAEIAQWVTYSDPKFTIKPGEWFTEKITIALPQNAKYSYSFAQIISRTNNPDPSQTAGRQVRGSLAVFTLINADKPGATSSLEITDFSTPQQIYEYLPATINMTFKNTGNTFVMPSGNVFIQRSGDDKNNISVLPVNEKNGYILAGSIRTMTTKWTDGFPSYKITQNADGSESRTEVWDWSKVGQLRIGQYSAKLVAIYNNGQRDVPIEREITFWILPWKIILGALIILALVIYALWSIISKIWKKIRRNKKPKTTN